MVCSSNNKKARQNQRTYGFFLKIVVVDRFSSWIKRLSRLFILLKICLFEISQISLLVSATSLQRKTLPFFRVLMHPLPVSRSILLLKKLVLETCISKRICYFSLLICHPISGKQERTISQRGLSIRQNLENSKYISFPNVLLTKQFNLNIFLCCDKYH